MVRVLHSRSVSARSGQEARGGQTSLFHNLGDVIVVGAALALLWSARASQRRRLRDLDAARLADLGITPEQALHEAEKPMWRA